jgi:predicted ATP-dependent endonuclease of OLD family
MQQITTSNRSKLLWIEISNLGCIGEKALRISLDKILCLVGENNSGKSTILRAYELACGAKYNYEEDFSLFSSKAQKSTIVIAAYIPQGMKNIADKWIDQDENGNGVLKSRWTWDSNGNSNRESWNYEINDWDPTQNASGLDNVFISKLPKPYRIGALQNPDDEVSKLMRIVLDPLIERVAKEAAAHESDLSKAISRLNMLAKIPLKDNTSGVIGIENRLSHSHSKIFPDLSVKLDIDISEIKLDFKAAILNGSKISVLENGANVKWNRQGTGSQRALFWSLLQTRSVLQSALDNKTQAEKEIRELDSKINKAEKNILTLKKPDIIDQRRKEIEGLKLELSRQLEISQQGSFDGLDDFALPGYMLIIDEPEIALHPNAVRAASKFLYQLSKDANWQVMITTHSPVFVDPLEDHTTVVRLVRNKSTITPNTYRSDEVEFSDKDLENLKMLNLFDQNLAEAFFGQHPIIVEGDTEFAAFRYIMQEYPDEFPEATRPVILRARSKGGLISLIKMLSHFKTTFSVLHDSDSPKGKGGGKNPAWSLNQKIYDTIVEARSKQDEFPEVIQSSIIHRVSIVDFETFAIGPEFNKAGRLTVKRNNKPQRIIAQLKQNPNVTKRVKDLLHVLANPNSLPDQEALSGIPFMAAIEDEIKAFANKYSIPNSHLFL